MFKGRIKRGIAIMGLCAALGLGAGGCRGSFDKYLGRLQARYNRGAQRMEISCVDGGRQCIKGISVNIPVEF